MGFKFRKSFKIAPGIKFNVNKKSVGFTFGKRGAHFTINSKGKRTTSIGIPGTGLSYTSSSGGKKSSKKQTVKQQNNIEVNNSIENKGTNQTAYHKNLFLILGILIILWGLSAANIFILALGIFCIYKSQRYNNNLLELKNKEVIANYNISASDLMNISTYCKQLKETIDLIETSKNPDTVISRFDFLEGIYSKLSCISDSVPNWDELDKDLQNLISNRDDYVNNTIHKSLDAELIRINQLKTEKGKINRLNRFFENTRAIPNLSDENYGYIDKLEKETKIL